MKDILTSPAARDAVDLIVDELLEHPSRAEAIKTRLRQKLDTPPPRQAGVVESDDPDDLWENLPV
jgi:hypothetical protein